MQLSTVSGLVRKVQIKPLKDGQTVVNFCIWARPYGTMEDVRVGIHVLGRQANSIAEVIDDDCYVTCFGGLFPIQHTDGSLGLQMKATKIEMLGVQVDYLEDTP
ncbi:hypothetical protein Q5Y75_05875 [Ruegeria sp. 2205SS24-7]|uniref:hypothetical protein n=1 Tax=Ruegeria discodermiae TaxID=3064389 RepID=UPI002740D45A|nr:hypothetical protein [Ruegeria sp. 2205SS24-7]MDP5216740.1 hypothetical protein [Ruegeria sp. 2205SS24-7]